jgi:hypothetical protein
MVNVSLGAGEIITILGAIVGLAWTLLKLTINQFEKRLDTKFSLIDSLLLDVKKLELEQLKRDNHYAEKFATKGELDSANARYEKTTERIFSLLQTINDKLDNKVSRSECEAAMRKASRDSQ